MEKEKVVEVLAKMKYDAQLEIGELNLYLSRDDIPNWRVSELKDRVRSLETRINIIVELTQKIS